MGREPAMDDSARAFSPSFGDTRERSVLACSGGAELVAGIRPRLHPD
jgi:hypothetical protein